MNDKLRAIEMETARLKLERERLAFKRETESQRRIEKAAQIGGAMIETTREVGSGLWKFFKLLFIMATGGFIGILALLAFAAFQALTSKTLPGDFEYRFGTYMGGVANWVYPVVIITGMIWFASTVYSKK